MKTSTRSRSDWLVNSNYVRGKKLKKLNATLKLRDNWNNEELAVYAACWII